VSVSDPEQSFDLEFEAEGELLVISWRAESRYQGGASPPPEIEARARRKFGGEVHVNLGTGHIARNMGRTAKARVERSVDDTPATHDADVIARLTPPGARASSVVNGRLFYLVEPATDGTSPGSRLVCLDLKDGAVRWERMPPGRRVMRRRATTMKWRIHGQAEIYQKDDEISRQGASEACDESGQRSAASGVTAADRGPPSGVKFVPSMSVVCGASVG
jgi:hypothetical protein